MIFCTWNPTSGFSAQLFGIVFGTWDYFRDFKSYLQLGLQSWSLITSTRSAALDQLIHFWDEMRWCAMCIRDHHHHHLCFTFKTSFWSKMVERFWKFVPKRISKLAHYSKAHILFINPILRYLNVCTFFSQNFFLHEKPTKTHLLGWLTFYRLERVEFYRYQKFKLDYFENYFLDKN